MTGAPGLRAAQPGEGTPVAARPRPPRRDGTNLESLPETHEYLASRHHHVDERYDDRMLLGEADQWRRHAVRTLERARSLADLAAPGRDSELSSTLGEWIVERRWFRGRSRRVRSARLADDQAAAR